MAVPTEPVTISELQNPWHNVFDLNNISQSPDLEALKLRKARSAYGGIDKVFWPKTSLL